MMSFVFSGLELLETSVIIIDQHSVIVYINLATQHIFKLSNKQLINQPLNHVFLQQQELFTMVDTALHKRVGCTEYDLTLTTPNQTEFHVNCTITPIELGDASVLLEFKPMNQQLKIANEERILQQQQANKELIRHLAHEIRNPLGGIRGAAQLLEHELAQANLKEYTQVIIKEVDRLQSLMDRLLTPHRLPQLAEINIHEVLERVRSLILAETPRGITIHRDYDTSLPLLTGDLEQLIQAILNIARNAAQAINSQGIIIFRTRIARQVTLARTRYSLALRIEIIDNGPGIPAAIRDSIFYPLVSGREGGHGVGLTLAQTFIHQHHGSIDFESEPGRTCFTLLIPIVQYTDLTHKTEELTSL